MALTQILDVLTGELRPSVIIGLSPTSASESFETVSKNLKSFPFTINKTGSVVNSISYTTLEGSITKSFGYSGNLLVSITLSGNLPNGISTVKTLTYSAGVLTGASYS